MSAHGTVQGASPAASAHDGGTRRGEHPWTWASKDASRPSIEVERRGRPEEVAAATAFLCSARASYVIGSSYRVDAGSVVTI
ncbi:SDR family oxidoreductase [Cellulosimicrobium arenosum]|uniref:SDR family oxidoreductase n=1 Tax=Cellulosimicrobium arenosum TaxID=2708133 RepID=A0A927J0I0_9MICO|nr:SDR family oxidoreductase [Cellulosimicrobium arenosum]MBD8079644.1 SDR family oxidoreductase [Cellulosimicrobium arenosum]